MRVRPMVDALNILFNTLWILGLAIILAAFSYSTWRVSQHDLDLRDALNGLAFQILLSLGLLLVSLALALLAERGWEQLLWLVFVGLFSFQIWSSRKRASNAKYP